MLSTDKQTNKQTDKLTNATKNITSFAKEVITKVYTFWSWYREYAREVDLLVCDFQNVLMHIYMY